jgi:glycosyltransferase involved in cell wall biosynthesis
MGLLGLGGGGGAMLSFIVPAYNEELLLGRTLEAIHASARTLNVSYEIIVADDASVDRTAAIAQEAGAVVVGVRHRQIAATRNSGARAARGDPLFFVDADTLVTPQVVRAALRALRRGVVGGGCSIRFDGRVPPYIRLLLPLATPLMRVLGLAGGCFLFCTRRAFTAAGGFSEELFAAEEAAFAAALKRQGRFVVLRESVTTSGRKTRTHSAWSILATLVRLGLFGPRTFRQREDLWYGERRADPDGAALADFPAQTR